MSSKKIPKIINPLGAGWQQPEADDIQITETHAKLTIEDFEHLLTYNLSLPSGKYEGKMWKTKYQDGWYLHWLENVENCLTIYCRKIMIITKKGCYKSNLATAVN